VIPTRETLVEALRVLVEVETPSGDLAALEEGFERLASVVLELTGRSAMVERVDGIPYLYLGATASPSVLVIGHLDTVWPRGTLAQMPFAVDGDVATGPGIFDMKAGLVIALAAIAGCAAADHVSLLVTGDEEIGSVTGRPLVERYAAAASAVLIPEPSANGGAIKKARKGVGMYEFSIRGREAHAGLEPERGINATVELAALVADLGALQGAADGTTVTVTTARSGTTANTVPAEATLCLDVRGWTQDELERIDRAIRARDPHLDGVEVAITGGINRPPLEERFTEELVGIARQAAIDTGLGPIGAVAVGGGSDGNFAAAMGIPTLDGIGAAGDGAHARHEQVDLASLVPRARWIARVVEQVVART